MSVLNWLQGLTAPKNDLAVVTARTEGPDTSFAGTKKNDSLTYDATPLFGDDTPAFTELDGGRGFDTLTIKLTESQHAAMKAELQAKAKAFFGDLKGGNFGLIGDLMQVLAGQAFVEIESLGLRLKGWESFKFEVVADPPPPVVATNDYSGSQHSIDLDLPAGTLQIEDDNSPQRADVTNTAADIDGYFAGGTTQAYNHNLFHYFIGSGLSDRMVGNENSNIFSGEGGNDYLYGNGGNDELRGEGGDDYLSAGVGDDWLVGGEGNDRAEGGDGDDNFSGGAGNDSLYGDAGDDLIDGGDGNDLIYGGAGNDALSGGDGDDTIQGQDGVDTIDGAAGNDTLTGGNDADTIHGGDGNDWVVGLAGDDVLNGNDGNDKLEGRDGNDIINGGAGVDLILGGAGDDMLCGGDGDDTILGEDGLDTIYGAAGNDTLTGGNDADTIYGGEGIDWLVGHAEDDVLEGGAGNDKIEGGTGADRIIGGAGLDQLRAGVDTDRDVFVFSNADRGVVDVVFDFDASRDMFEIDLADPLSDHSITIQGTTVTVTGDFDGVAGSEALVFSVISPTNGSLDPNQNFLFV